ncbi:hypothetical protein SAMN05519104_6662 [Rhizobiales bacterium GAS188]|nr:hypothetical protein SAMN05519104_6662 [Rhizobiales bacterium GAS188]
MLDRAAYVDALIGAPWQGDGLHCWALVRQVQRDLFGRELPAVLNAAPEDPREAMRLFASHHERGRWLEVQRPIDGAIMLASRALTGRRSCHAGVYLAIGQGGVLHVDAPHGVVLDDLMILAARRWAPIWLLPKVTHG